jgi:type I restriction enzyme, S subunit
MPWPMVPFGDIAEFRNGLNYTRDNHGDGLKVINVGDFGDRFVPDIESLGEINPNGIADDADYLQPADMLFVRSNGNREQIGRVMYMENIPYPIAFSAFCIRARIATPNALPKFYAYFFRSGVVRNVLSSIGGGASIANLNQGILNSFAVPFPDKKTQEAVVERLDAFESLLANCKRRIGILEKAARLIYTEWFVRLRFPGHQSHAIEERIPVGWSRLPLGDLAEIVMGQSPESKFFNEDGDGFPFHQGVTGFGDRFVRNETFTSQATRFAQAGDILCSVRAPVGRLNITLEKIAIGRGLSAMRSKAGHQSLLLYQLKALFVEEDMIGGGAIFASVGKKELFAQELLQPDSGTATEFNRLVGDIDLQIETLTRQIAELKKARDLLLPRLISGQLRL